MFQVTCKGKDSQYFTAFAQERITKIVQWLPDKSVFRDGHWVPANPADPTAVYFKQTSGGMIMDIKAVPRDPLIVNCPVNKVYLECHQDLRVFIFDPCGNLMAPIQLGKGFDVEVKRISDSSGNEAVITHTKSP